MKKIAFLLIAACLTTGQLFAAFETFNLAVKPMALVDTFSCLGDDPVGMIYNPAQTVQIEYPSLQTSFSKPNVGWGESDIGIYSIHYVYPGRDVNFGLGISHLSSNINYSETMAMANLAVKYADVYGSSLNVAWGVNGKMLSMKRGDPAKSWDPALKEATITKMTADAGLWLELNNYCASIAAMNIIPANFGVVETWNVPVETRLGFGIKDMLIANTVKLSPAVELTNRTGWNTVSGGANIYLTEMLDMQIGASEDNLGFGMTVYMPRPEKKEYEVQSTSMRVDVSWLYPISGIDTAGSPQIGILFYF